MADLDFLQRSSPIQITDHKEEQSVDLSTRQELHVADTIRQELVNGSVTVGTIAVEAKANTIRLDHRKGLFIYNNSNRTIYWGASGVTTSDGIPIDRNEFVNISIEDVPVFLISDQTNLNVRVVEYK